MRGRDGQQLAARFSLGRRLVDRHRKRLRAGRAIFQSLRVDGAKVSHVQSGAGRLLHGNVSAVHRVD